VSKAEAAAAAAIGSSSDEDDAEDDSDEEDSEQGSSDEEQGTSKRGAVPATTLTTTLIQALHSTDGPLLESCLTHSNPTLVRNTVQRLPSGTLVLSLLEALVERLGTGKKGAQGNASVKRSRALIEWVRQTLIVHVGFLVTVRAGSRISVDPASEPVEADRCGFIFTSFFVLLDSFACHAFGLAPRVPVV
jgi:U3 small nucleolar RNA-associated protein 5